MKRLVIAASLVSLVVGCRQGPSVDARWKQLGLPLDPDHATIELADDSTPNRLVVNYEDRRASKAIFELYRDAFAHAGYTADTAPDAGDDLTTKLHHPGAHDLSLYVHRISSATVVAIRED